MGLTFEFLVGVISSVIGGFISNGICKIFAQKKRRPSEEERR